MSFFSPFPSEYLTEEHKKRIGMAMWVLLWCIDKTTEDYMHESGERRGRVFGGRWVKHREIGEQLGISHDTVSAHLAKLAAGGYITIDPKPYGSVIEVRNSRKYQVRHVVKVRRWEVKRVEGSESGIRKYSESLPDQSKIAETGIRNISESEVRKCSESQAENDEVSESSLREGSEPIFTRQKQETKQQTVVDDDLPFESGTDDDAAERFLGLTPEENAFSRVSFHAQKMLGTFELNRSDVTFINAKLREGIPPETIIAGINAAFEEYQAKHIDDGERIGSISYCRYKIDALHKQNLQTSEQPAARRPYVPDVYQQPMSETTAALLRLLEGNEHVHWPEYWAPSGNGRNIGKSIDLRITPSR